MLYRILVDGVLVSNVKYYCQNLAMGFMLRRLALDECVGDDAPWGQFVVKRAEEHRRQGMSPSLQHLASKVHLLSLSVRTVKTLPLAGEFFCFGNYP